MMRVDRLVRLTTTLLIALLVGACGTSETLPEDRFYRLASLTTGPLDRRLLDGPLLVEPIGSYDVYRDRAMAFSPPDEPGSLQHHHYHFWVAPPPELVHEQLVDYLRQTGIATEVTTNRSGRIRPAARLASRLTRFERVLHADGGVEVVVALEFTLTRDSELILRRRYDGTTAADDGSFPASVRAADQGLARIYASVVADMVAALDAGLR
jgi:ABC-type uncharacterized transport system auxiliary subunit